MPRPLFAVARAGAAIAAILLVVACGRTGPVEVGLVLPFTGELGEGGVQMRQSIIRLLDESGVDVELLIRNDTGMPSVAAHWVNELSERGVGLIIGGMSSSCALAAASRAEAEEIPFITPMATHADVTRGRSWVFRMCFTDPQQGERMAKFAASELSVTRVGIIKNATNDYSMGLADAFSSEFLRGGGTIVAERCWRRDFDTAADLKQWLRRNRCDALYLPLYSRDIQDVMEKSRDYRARTPTIILGGDGFHASELTGYLSAVAEGERDDLELYATAHFAADRDAPEVDRFLNLVGRPGPGSAAALGYDIGRLLSAVLAEEGRDRTAIRDAIVEELSHFEGATGDCYLVPGISEMRKDIPILAWSRDGWMLRDYRP